MLDSDIELAKKEIKWAENRFNYAVGDQVNIAINELMEAEERLDNLFKKRKRIGKEIKE